MPGMPECPEERLDRRGAAGSSQHTRWAARRRTCQGESLDELKENIADAYRMMLEAEPEPEHIGAQTLEVEIDV